MAIIGMVIVNTRTIITAQTLETRWVYSMINPITGRAAAIFVMLAGAGMVMAYDRVPAFAKPLLKTRMIIRAIILYAIGFLLMRIWNADILHYYTAYLIGGVILLERRTKQIAAILWMLVVVSMPICALVSYDYEGGDIIATLFGQGPFATMADYFFLSTYYPVLPWFCFFLIGMLLGRLERLPGKRVFYIIFACSSVGVITIEFLSALLNAETIAGRWIDIEMPSWRAFSLSEAFPVGPLYLLSASASSLALIAFLRIWPERTQPSRQLSPMVAFGRLSLTFYISHILIGHACDRWIVSRQQTVSSHETLLFTAIFILVGIVFAKWWMHHFQRGPLEMVVNQLISGFLKLKPVGFNNTAPVPGKPLQTQPSARNGSD